ncbi:MAG: ester cyclase [Burkholderiales bacterium]
MSMKNTYRLLLLVVLSIGASLAQAGQHGLLKLLDNYIAAWNSHDPDKVVAYLADEMTYYDPMVGNMKSEDEVRKFVKRFVDFSPDYRWVIAGKPMVSKDSVAFEWHFTGTNTGAVDEKTPATGKAYDIYGASIIRFRHGKIVFEGDYWDQVGFRKQLGLMQ